MKNLSCRLLAPAALLLLAVGCRPSEPSLGSSRLSPPPPKSTSPAEPAITKEPVSTPAPPLQPELRPAPEQPAPTEPASEPPATDPPSEAPATTAVEPSFDEPPEPLQRPANREEQVADAGDAPSPGGFKEQATKPRTDLPPLTPDAKGVFEITFQDIELDMEAATVFEEETMMTERVRGLLGKKVRIRGFIHGGTTFTPRDIKQFVMVRNAECPFGGAEGVACHNIRVTLDRGVDFTVKPLTIEGKFELNPWTGPDDKTWSVYTLHGKAL